jgi:hypothetical protein
MEKMELPADNCPVAPPSQVTVYTRVLHHTCQIIGGVAPLAARLRVPVATLYRWLDDELLAQALRGARSTKKPLT